MLYYLTQYYLFIRSWINNNKGNIQIITVITNKMKNYFKCKLTKMAYFSVSNFKL